MLTYVVLALVGFGVMLTMSNWRWGFYLIIVAAAIQDPLRKLMPDAPGWMALASAPIFLAAAVSCGLARADWWQRFKQCFPSIGKALRWFVIAMIPAAVLSATYGGGSWQYTLLGVFSYSIMFLAIVTGFYFARDLNAVLRLLKFYCLVHGVMLVGSLIEYMEWLPGWAILGDDALGFRWLRWIPGYIIRLYSGFYRSADVMGWHAAAVSILSLVLAFGSKGRRRWFWVAMAAWAVLALFLCGRRKMVYMIPVFLLALGWIYVQAGRSSRIVPLLGFLLLPAISVYYVSDFLGEDSGQMRFYYSENAGDGVFDRLVDHGFGSLVETYRQSGFFGEGLGFATPGSHHIEGAHPRVWQESGTSRVLVELGVPGFLGFLAVVFAVVGALWRTVRGHLLARTPASNTAAGILAFFIANVGSLTVSGQILSDSFIAVFLGFMVGIVLGMVRAPFVPAPTIRAVAMPQTRYASAGVGSH